MDPQTANEIYKSEMDKRIGQLRLSEENLKYNLMVLTHRVEERKWGEAVTALSSLQVAIQRIQEVEFEIRSVKRFKPKSEEENVETTTSDPDKTG